jgi:low affinity Fe/Cu permease
MDFDTLERLWQSETNNQASVAETYVFQATLKTLKMRRSKVVAGMQLIGLGLFVWTCAIIYALVVGKISNLSQEWGIVALLFVSWLVFFAALLQQRRHMLAHPRATANMPEVLRALIDENRTAQARARMMAIALIVFIAVLGLCQWQLYLVGKMELRHIIQGSILFGSALGLSFVIHTIRYVRTLRPEGERLQRLLDQYEANE